MLNKEGVSAAPQPSLRTRHLRVLLLFTTLAPLVALVNILLGDTIAHLPVLLRSFLVVGLVVPAATYVALPLLTGLSRCAIGRESWREMVGQTVYISVVPVS